MGFFWADLNHCLGKKRLVKFYIFISQTHCSLFIWTGTEYRETTLERQPAQLEQKVLYFSDSESDDSESGVSWLVTEKGMCLRAVLQRSTEAALGFNEYLGVKIPQKVDFFVALYSFLKCITVAFMRVWVRLGCYWRLWLKPHATPLLGCDVSAA